MFINYIKHAFRGHCKRKARTTAGLILFLNRRSKRDNLFIQQRMTSVYGFIIVVMAKVPVLKLALFFKSLKKLCKLIALYVGTKTPCSAGCTTMGYDIVDVPVGGIECFYCLLILGPRWEFVFPPRPTLCSIRTVNG